MTLPPASDPRYGRAPDLPGHGAGTPGPAPLDTSATTRFDLMPGAPRRNTHMLNVAGAVLAVLLVVGVAATVLYVFHGKKLGPDIPTVAKGLPDNPAFPGNLGSAGRTSPGGSATAASGGSPAGTAPKTLAAGAAALLDDGANQVRVTVDRIAVHRRACGRAGLNPANGYYVTARVTYVVVKGSASVSALNFADVGADGTPGRQVGAGFTGCARPDLPVAFDSPAGTKRSGYLGFDGTKGGVITYTSLGLDQTPQATWQIG